ncbi:MULTISPECIES: cell division protein ZapA [Kosmotoga]|jgi:cell division protein ZapA (FtsZ GTPase activity inhibitor)|uniref:Cell division protein ZapA n=1 Tax=Kosmotoga olearia (strain ATCC BAA-1733 / DSM 21960 / TBF 19.5.1) TaxID=521045 RepID=C5CHM6_KOSOT|nr:MULTISPECIES: cell division protein ZapA [Kosmotoga]ACR80702.1 hypothetical protein Kole_2024 [Kosmotoga olearia TBF 19.5.1]MDI3524059.1 hypothetical protein [Kosmotoga sp.]MDK2953478.1 hypothetical protein [Kosmotoga sp.]OAA19151.1 cell division protein ZapA [Kosmotoga sp. DU53]
MKRPVVLKLGEKEFQFLTTEPPEIVDKVFEEIQQEYALLEKEVEKAGFERILVALLVNVTNDLVKTQNELRRLKEKYDSVLDEYYKGRGRVDRKG